jgi:hypothetical protein
MSTDDVPVVDKDGGETVRIQGVTPIVIDLGKRSKKSIKNLKEGRGKLMQEVGDTIDQVRCNLGSQGAEVLPVVLIYRQKAQSKRSPASFLPLLPPPFNLLRS